ncbi:MAG: DNA cytosine methyltransferase [Chthoniobacterales bacterium]
MAGETRNRPTVLELCAGGGGQTIGLEDAGFECVAAVEIEPIACETLKSNRPMLQVLNEDIRHFDGDRFAETDVVTAGVPCPPFSVAGKQLGKEDDRDLFPEVLRIIAKVRPKAVMLENVPGFASAKFSVYRNELLQTLRKLGFEVGFGVLNASHFGVPQLRPRFVLVGVRKPFAESFSWPIDRSTPLTVGECLQDLMAENGWPGAEAWARRANNIAPTVVGGSKKHGGPDLGPTRAKLRWRELGVDGLGIADAAPSAEFPEHASPKLTVRMVARLQGFPDRWMFAGRKTAAYRQVGNAFPPPVAAAVGAAIRHALSGFDVHQNRRTDQLLNTALVGERVGSTAATVA